MSLLPSLYDSGLLRAGRRMAVSLLLTMLAGCSVFEQSLFSTTAGTDYSEVARWTTQVDAVAGKTRLLELIATPGLEIPLERAVNQALVANPGLQQTLMAWRMAHHEITVSNADRLPQLNGSLSGSHNDYSSSSNDTLNLSFNASWELDLWGRLADQVEAAEQDSLASLIDYQAARNSLAAEVIQLWLDLSSQQQMYRFEMQRAQDLKRLQDAIARRYRLGLSTLSDLDTARSTALGSLATAQSYQQQADDLRRQLNRILGGESGVLPDGSETFPEVIEPLAAVPSESLGNRPDLKAAYARILAEEARTQVAYKELLPSIDFSMSLNFRSGSGGGSGGSSSSGSSSSNNDDYDSNYSNYYGTGSSNSGYGFGGGSSDNGSLFENPNWSMMGTLNVPVFNGGRRLAEAQIAELTAEQSYWSFREALLTAVYEIDNAIGTENSLQMRLGMLNKALKSAERSADRYLARYQSGLVDILDLIDIQTQVYDLRIQIVELTYQQLSNRVGLGLALGLQA